MEEKNNNQEKKEKVVPSEGAAVSDVATPIPAPVPAITPVVKTEKKRNDMRPRPAKGSRPARGGKRGGRKGFGERVKPEFDQKVVDIRRVTRVVSGGRRFSFSVVMVLGNKKGKVGVGIGKASDTALAIEKSIRNAKKNMIELKLTENNSIPYEVEAKYNASVIVVRPAQGRGVVAGSSARTILELAGVSEVGAKVLSRSKNKLNNARATIKALSEFKK